MSRSLVPVLGLPLLLALSGCPQGVELGPDGEPPPSSCSSDHVATTLATGRNQPASLVIDGDHVYWTEAFGAPGGERRGGGRVLMAPLAGGEPVELHAVDDVAGFALGDLTVTNGVAYWTEERTDGAATRTTLRQLALGAAAAVVTDVLDGEQLRFTLDASHIYFARPADDAWSVARLPLTGGDVEALGTAPTDPDALFVDDDAVYARGTGVAGRWRMGKAGGDAEQLLPGREVYGLGADDDALYWFDRDGRAIMRMAKADGVPTTLTSVRKLDHLRVEDDALYIAQGTGISRVDKTSGAITPVLCPVEGGDKIAGLAGDAGRLYWLYDHAYAATGVRFTDK